MNAPPRILVVDDEPGIVRAISIALTSHGYDVETAATVRQAVAKAAGTACSLVVLDLGLPDGDGLTVIRELRAFDHTTPIIVVSAIQHMDMRVQALDLGADDFVPKPFGMPELLARIRVALRHAEREHDGGGLEASSVTRGPIRIDTATRQATVNDDPIELTRTQYELLLCFVRHPNRVLTHRTITNEVWGVGEDVETENLRKVVSELRRRIEADPAHPKLIVTELGVGYRFTPEP